MIKDMKEALSSGRKADTTHVRKSFKIYCSRACEYGSSKYERANYLRPASGNSMAADFERLRAYLRAASAHIDDVLDSMERHQASDPKLLDEGGMRVAAYAEDTDAKPGCPVGASGLPHLAHACASIMMAVEQATLFELLPADPGQPWVERKKAAELAPADGETLVFGSPSEPVPMREETRNLRTPGYEVGWREGIRVDGSVADMCTCSECVSIKAAIR